MTVTILSSTSQTAEHRPSTVQSVVGSPTSLSTLNLLILPLLPSLLLPHKSPCIPQPHARLASASSEGEYSVQWHGLGVETTSIRCLSGRLFAFCRSRSSALPPAPHEPQLRNVRIRWKRLGELGVDVCRGVGVVGVAVVAGVGLEMLTAAVVLL
ncbi:uncharacterized protein EI97DRAFT_16070 [Westerdykella ornata]|uniref:Uncharacterized protein n=1 Tax=Westerdykella ornata TaxID=318751 RepID=A0A6A6JWJ2_WESOR|nr:uncharacterized protein EI97DRAFT_16070 [Westerdykella ornata]KAF2280972.1 hypothetical protein EI97DRAFT_16070 [Westerdykella ornata]